MVKNITFQDVVQIGNIYYDLIDEIQRDFPPPDDPTGDKTLQIGQSLYFLSLFSNIPLIYFLEKCREHPNLAVRFWAYHSLEGFRKLRFESLLRDKTLLN